MNKIPFVYKKLLELDDFKKKDLKLTEFQKALLSFRISKKDWLKIAKDLNGYGIVEIEGKEKINQHTKIVPKKR